MKTIRISFFQMLAYMRRDRMLFAACLAPILAGFLFRFAIPLLEAALTDWFHVPAIIVPYYALIDIFFAMLSPAMFCFVSAMVALEETDEKTAAYLFVTPLGRNGYLASRLGIPSVAAFLVTSVLMPVFKLTSLSTVDIILLAAGGTLQGIIISLLILTPLYNFINDTLVSESTVLRHLLRHLILYWFRLFP